MDSQIPQEEQMGEATVAILNPIATAEIWGVQPAERITDLNNKRIGLVWNTKARGDVALRKIEAVLKKRFRGMEFTWLQMQTSISVVPEQIKTLKHLKNDAIISSTGD
jgi:hypothetical protein